MRYHTAGGWIQAFAQAMTRQGYVVPHFYTQVCGEHPDCILIVCHGQRDHVPWRETDPTHAAASILHRRP
jgi:hypothetical protein